MRIFVIIPALNEEGSIAKVIQDIPQNIVSEIIVVNNGSTDNTAVVAQQAGARVLEEPRRGYGYACLKGIAYAESQNPDILVFMDADYSDFPEELPLLLEPIYEQNMDMVIGSRALGNKEFGSMTIPQIFGNWLATKLLYLFYGLKFTDLGPFRAIRMEALKQLKMQDKTYGWTVEMQLKAAKMKLKSTEVAVNYRKRIGYSKVSGTIRGTVMAGYKILWTIFKYL